MQSPTVAPPCLGWSSTLLGELQRCLAVIASNRYDGTLISLAPPTVVYDAISALITLTSLSINKGNMVVVSQKTDLHSNLLLSLRHWMDERDLKDIVVLNHDTPTPVRRSVWCGGGGKIVIVPPLIFESDIKLSNCRLGKEDFCVFLEPMLPSTSCNWTPLLRRLFVAKTGFEGGFIIFSYTENLVHLPFPLKWPRITKYVMFSDSEILYIPNIFPIVDGCLTDGDTLIISDDPEVRSRFFPSCSVFGVSGRRVDGCPMLCTTKDLSSENWDPQGTRIPLDFFNLFKRVLLFFDPLKKDNQSIVSILGRFPKIAVYHKDPSFSESLRSDRRFCLHKIEKWSLQLPSLTNNQNIQVIEREFKFIKIQNNASMATFCGVDEMIKEMKFNIPPVISLTKLPPIFQQGNCVKKSSISLMIEEFRYLFPSPPPSQKRNIRLEMLKYLPSKTTTSDQQPIRIINEFINKINQ